MSTLLEAAAEADALAQRGAERELADLRARWAEEIESAAHSDDYRERAVAYRAIGQFRFRQRLELLRRGLEDQSPAVRGSALISLELLSRESPGAINAVRALLHELATNDPNQAVRRLAILCLANGPAQRETMLILVSFADDEEQERELRATAKKVADSLRRKAAQR